MLVKFKRPFFGPDANLYPAALVEVPSDWSDALPKDAVILSGDATLPSPSVKPKAGFGAKPENEQVLDNIPFAAPTHQIARLTGDPMDGLHPPRSIQAPSDPNVNEERRLASVDAQRDRQEAKVEEASAAVSAGIDRAKEMAVAQAEATGDESRIREAEAINPGSGTVPSEQPKDRSEADTMNRSLINAGETNRGLNPSDVPVPSSVSPAPESDPAKKSSL